MNNLVVGLSSWIIQDGNYPDFERGQQASFAIEFYAASGLSACEVQGSPSLSPVSTVDLHAPLYDGIGRVVHVAQGWWVVDFGVCAFRG